MRKHGDRRIMQDLRVITAEVLTLMADAGLMMREALAIAMRRYGYEQNGGGSP